MSTLTGGEDRSSVHHKEAVTPNVINEVREFIQPHHPRPTRSYWRVALVLTMHAILVGIFVALIGLRYHHRDQPLPIRSKHFITGLLVDKAVVSVNSIFKVYWNALLIVTQAAALQNTLHSFQTLTAIHDKIETWSTSVYKSPLILFDYRTLFKTRKANPQRWKKELEAFAQILCIIAYLGCGEGLGYLAPALVVPTLTLGNSTSFQNLTLYIENIGQDPNQLKEAFPVLSILPLLFDGNVITLGLQDNLIYDVPNFVSEGAIGANGVVFNVTCQNLPDAAQTGSPNQANSMFEIHISDDLQNINVSPSSRTLNIRPAAWANSSASSTPPSTLILASTFPVLDINSTKASVVSLSPEVTPIQCAVESDCSAIVSLQVMACDVGAVNLRNGVSVFTGNYPLLDTGINQNISGEISFWQDWTPPDSPTAPELSSIGDLGALAPASHTVQQYQIGSTGVAGNNTLSILEDNVMETLGYYRADIQSVDLASLEFSLGQAIASLYWRAATRSWDNLTFAAVDPNPNADNESSVSISISESAPWVGLGLAITMTILATYLAMPPRRVAQLTVKSPSVLELTYLLGKPEKSIANDLFNSVQAGSKELTMDNLRDKGKDIHFEF